MGGGFRGDGIYFRCFLFLFREFFVLFFLVGFLAFWLFGFLASWLPGFLAFRLLLHEFAEVMRFSFSRLGLAPHGLRAF